MKKINEQTKSFLLYGIEDVIKPKEIYKLGVSQSLCKPPN